MHTVVILGAGTLGTRQFALWQDKKVHMTVIDRDIVNSHNVGKQLFFTDNDVGTPKVHALPKREHTTRIAEEITADNASLCNGDVIIDCTDNLATRLIVSAFAYANNIPFVYGGAVGTQGACGVFSGDTCAFGALFGNKVDGEDCTQGNIDLTVADHVAQQQFLLAQRALQKEHDQHLYTCDTAGCRKGALLPTGNVPTPQPLRTPTKLCGGTFQAWVDTQCARTLVGDAPFVKHDTCTIFPNGRVLVRCDDAHSAQTIAFRLCQ